MQSATPPIRTVHSTFTVERTYPAPPARVFAAFADPASKRRWFVEGEGWQIDSYSLDFRVGGWEISRFRFAGGPPMTNDTVYMDIVPDQRIIFAYTMTAGGQRISVSQGTVLITPAGSGARVVYTEQGAFLDGSDNLEGRLEGTRELFEKLAEELESHQ